MVQQWFLDLDGVRSGPYQTPEVLSLIAEGEILPHHRISEKLMDKPWTTILEWRLEQAKESSPQRPASTPIEPKLESTRPIEGTEKQKNPYEIFWNEDKKSPPIEKNIGVGPVDLNPEAHPDEVIEVFQTLKLEPRHSTPVAPIPSAPAPSTVATSNRRLMAEPSPHDGDPVADMYDLLHSRLKRETKGKALSPNETSGLANQAATTSQTVTPAITTGQTAWRRTLFIALIITAIGFGLGQLLQQAPKPESTDAKPVEKTTIAPAPIAKPQVIDRSTDKMTIRSKVDPEVAKQNGGAPPDKEHEELIDLKKEITELKALKEEVQNNTESINTQIQNDGADGPMDEDYLNPEVNGQPARADPNAGAPEATVNQ